MSSIITTAGIVKLITPLIKDIYSSAKNNIQTALAGWKTESGIRKIATNLSKLEKVKTVWSPEHEISLSKFYYPSKISIGFHGKDIYRLEDLPRGNVVIEGIVGQGKSIFMRHLALTVIINQPVLSIPIFIELRNITKTKSLHECISLFLESINIEDPLVSFDYLASYNKIVLILDGFDEIPNECVAGAISDVDSLQTRYTELKIIISSRPKSHIQNLNGFNVYKLLEIQPAEYDIFVSKLITASSKRMDVVDALNNCSSGIKGVITTPLMLTLVVMTYQTEKSIPSTLHAFFEKLFNVVFSKHDRYKAGFNRQHYSGLSEDLLKRLFEAFCFMTVNGNNGRTLSNSKFNQSFNSAIKFLPELKCSNDDFRKDIINVACLILEEGLDSFTFLHKSILDYHAAAFIMSFSDQISSAFYKSAFKNFNQWEHVLYFLESIDNIRYSRYYITNNLPSSTAELTHILESRDDQRLIRSLEKTLPKFSIIIGANGPETISRDRFSGNEVSTEIQRRFPSAIFEQCKKASQQELTRASSLSGFERFGRAQKASLTLSSLLLVFGTDFARSILSEVENQCIRRIEFAKQVIEQDAARDDFLNEIFKI